MENTELYTKEAFIEMLKLEAKPFVPENVRQHTLNYLEQMNLPSRDEELWRHTDIRKVLNYNYKLNTNYSVQGISLNNYKITGCDAYTIVTVNGKYISTLSDKLPAGIEICEIKDAKNSEIEPKFQEISGNTIKNFWQALNIAFSENGFYLKILKNSQTQKPVHILNFVNSTDYDSLILSNNLIVAEENAQATILQTYQNLTDNFATLNSVYTGVFVEKNANLSIHATEQQNLKTFVFNTIQVKQLENSVFNNHQINKGTGLTRNELEVTLAGQYSEANLNGLFLPSGGEHIDNYLYVHHAVPNCQSNQLYKGIGADNGSGVFLGKILVDKYAQKTNAFQSNKNIVLTRSAKINSKPQLEIYADDVKCSHGSSTGQLNKDALFYMQARGIGKEMAQKLLLEAFTSEVLNKATNPGYREFIRQQINPSTIEE